MKQGTMTLLVCCALAAGGCAGGGGAPPETPVVAEVSYSLTGEGHKAYDIDLDTAFEAAVKAVRKLSFVVDKRAVDKSGGEIKARTALDEKVVVRLIPITAKATNVRVHVGTFGDKRVTGLFFEALEKQFK